MNLLIFLNFPDNEKEVLVGVAEKVGVFENSMFKDDVGELLEETSAIGNQITPDIVFIDGDEPNVAETVKSLKSNDALKKYPLVVMSINQNREHILGLYSLGINSYIVKPDSFAKMVEAAEGILSYWMKIAQLPSQFEV